MKPVEAEGLTYSEKEPVVPLSDKEHEKAYYHWYLNHYRAKEVDDEVSYWLSGDLQPFQPSKRSWLKMARDGLFLSSETLAERLTVSRSAYSQLEHSERVGRIILAKLAEAAEAMDCELVYALRPKRRKRFSELIWEILFPVAFQYRCANSAHNNRRWAATATVACIIQKRKAFRRKQGWKRRSS